MSVSFAVTFLLMFVQCGASIMTHGHAQKVTPQSSQQDGASLLTDMTQGTVFQHDSMDYFVSTADESSPSNIDVFTEDEATKRHLSLNFPPSVDFSLNNNIPNAARREKVKGYIPAGKLRLTRKRRDAENTGSVSLPRLFAALKAIELENHQVKSTVNVLQAASETFASRLQEFEAKFSMATAQQMTEATAAHHQQQMALGQLQLQLSQLSTKVMNLQEENDVLHRELRLLKEEADVRQPQLAKTWNVTLRLQAENSAIYTQLQNLTAARHTQNQTQDPALLEKLEMLQEQTRLLDAHLSELSVLSQELLAANRSLHLRDAAFEDRLESQVSDLQQGNKDLTNRMLNQTCPSRQGVGFHARLSNSIDAPDGALIVDKVEYSSGGGYNPQTGIFTSPVTGLYLFLANMAADSTGNTAWITVVLDKTELCKAWSRYSTEIEMASCHAAAKVVKGQQVSVTTQSGIKRRIRGQLWTTFSGVLIQRED